MLILSTNIIYATAMDNNTEIIQNQDTSVDLKQESNDLIYVNSNSNNTLEDGSKQQPYKTINDENLNEISSDSTIIVSNGTYYLNSTILDKNISIIGENRDNVIFIPNNASIFTINSDVNVVLENITIKNQSSTFPTAITNNGNLTINNISFLNNIGAKSNTKGTCILNTGNLSIVNSNFENNTASFGAAVYNTGNAFINNSKFKKNNISNVGGAIYSMRGNLTVYNSNFLYNAATSGSAIYNAGGYLYVNQTEFFKNDAERFFGGAIYSTGITIVDNSQFLSNHARIDGGAITNTNNFTITNCYFEQNNAEQNGGCIENVPWSTSENGNLTIYNSTFKENSAGINGGAIMNYNKEDYYGDYCTVTVTQCIFDSNTASKSGGAIYNEQYIDFEYNVFVNNDADTNKTISSNSDLIKSINNNWWATNNPTQSKLGVMPENWIVMNFTNTTPLVKNFTSNVEVSLNTLDNGQSINQTIPSRYLRLICENTTFPNSIVSMTGCVNYTVEVLDDVLYAQIDNQRLSLNVAQLNVSYSFVNDNKTLQVKLDLPEDINGKTSVKINSITIFNKEKIENGTSTLEYNIPAGWTRDKYNMSVVFVSDDNQVLRINDLEINIPKREVESSIYMINDTPVKVGSKIQLVADIKINNESVNSGKVSFKINSLTIQSNVKVINGKAIINYTIPTTFTRNNYTFSIVYSGDGNKNSSKNELQLNLSKHNIYSNITDTLNLTSDADNSINIYLFDEENQKVNVGRACIKVNHITMQTNITVNDSMITFNYKTPKTNNTKTQVLTVKYGGTQNYNSFEKDIDLIIK